MITDIVRPRWSQARPAERTYLTAAVLIGVGLAHGLVWLVLLAVAWVTNAGTAPRRVRYVAPAALGYVLLFGLVLGLALAGAAVGAPGPVGGAVGAAGLACLVAAAAGALLRRLRAPR